MRRFVLLFGAILLVSLSARAQENTITFAPPSPAASPASPQIFRGSNTPDWQLAFGYQYNRAQSGLSSSAVSTSGVHFSVVRFFGSYFGLEGDVGAGFGNTGSSTFFHDLNVNNVFVGGGPHVSLWRSRRVEPFADAIVGLEHFRYTQTDFLGSQNALGYTLGGGVDWHLNSRTAVRTEADYLGIVLDNTNSNNLQLVFGLVFNL